MLRLTNLRCEYLPDPIGIVTTSPRFSWELEHPERGQKQSAYQIQVASNQNLLNTNTGDLWDSGKVLSDRSVNVVYAGKTLESGTTCYWKVCAWDAHDRVSEYSSAATFEMSLLDAEDWQGEWIAWDGENSPLFRQEFVLDKPVKRGRLYISGLGYYEARINGRKVGDHVLDPGWTDYEKTVLYASFDVTNLLQTGGNAIGVMLGNGRFCPPDEVLNKPPNPLKKYGQQPLFLAQLNVEYSDGTLVQISTNSDWKSASGPIVYNDLYDGEIYDARLERSGWDFSEYDDTDWQSAKQVPCPGGKLVSQTGCPPIKVVRTIAPQTLTTPKMGVFVYDFGQNFTGWVKLRVRGPRGTKVKIRYAELLHEDGNLNTLPNRSAKATDVYILKGEDEECFEPHFTYHGFRYVEMTGFPGTPALESLEGCVAHSAVPPTGRFLCSFPLINQIHQNVLWGQLSNLMSIPTDCPQRDERLGWLGDAHLTAEEAIYNFEMAGFYTKWMRDIRDAQKENGSVPDVVPTHWELYPADPAWGIACILIPWEVYRYYGDEQILEQNYPMMKSYVEFLQSLAQDDMLYLSKYGDWCPPWHVNSMDTPQELVSQWCYYYSTLSLSNIARILGKPKDAERFAAKAENIKGIFNQNFLRGDRYTGDEHHAQYLKFIPPQVTDEERTVMEDHLARTLEVRSQTGHVLALYLDLVPPENKLPVLQSLIDDIVVLHGKHVNTGIIGTRYLLDVLSDNGYSDLAFQLVTQTTYPGWGYMVKEGATTMWERWEYLTETGMNSQNHIMLGSVDAWFYRYLAGIQIDPAEPGWKSFRIQPHILGDLQFVSASVQTVRGLVASRWSKSHNSLEFHVTVPVNSQAIVSIPKIGLEHVVITEGETVIWKDGSPGQEVAGVSGGREEGEFVSFEVGSGAYCFQEREKIRYSALQ